MPCSTLAFRLLSISSLFLSAWAGGVTSYGEDFGFIGYGIKLYDPLCAWSCIFCNTAPLNCTTEALAVTVPEKRSLDTDETPQYPSGPGWNVTLAPTPQCRVENDFYLQTVAYCMKSRCTDIPLIKLEKVWDASVPWQWTGDKASLPIGRQSYTQVLAAIKETPTQLLNNTVFLNYTAVTPDEIYLLDYQARLNYANNELPNEKYGFIILISGVAIPIGLSFLRFLPWPSSWAAKFNAYVIDPPLVGSQHSTPIWGLGIMPTRGQAIFIAYFWIINIIFTACGYEVLSSTFFYPTQEEAVDTYVANRNGVLSLAHLPLVFLYAGRNNLLLWLTNWSQSTFLLLHRWTAFLCMLHAVLHSLVYLHMAVAQVRGYVYSEVAVEPYWYWGIIGTLSMVILVVASVQPIRQRAYELFLAIHIAMAVMAIVGCYYHVVILYDFDWGHQTWLHISIAVWAFDRVVRWARSFRGGIKRAYLTPIDDQYYRLDIPGATASGHVYLHFPTISLWRIWENHPFSVGGVTRSRNPPLTDYSLGASTDHEPSKEVRVGINQDSDSPTESDSVQQSGATAEGGIVLFVRKHNGITSKIPKYCDNITGALVIVEGSYGPGTTFLQGGHITPTHEFPNILCIAGGVGVTGVMPSLDSFSAVAKPLGSKKIYWGVRSMPLVHAVENMLGYDGKDSLERRWGDVNVTLSVGERLDLRTILETELRSQKGGTTVVVCGPTGMADDVRCIVSGISRHDGDEGPVLVQLVVESFSW